jgi:hypothetical protein
MNIPFSYSNTCGMGLDTFGACKCGGRYKEHSMVEQLPTAEGTPLPVPDAVPIRTAKKNTKSQSKPLLFINADAKHLKSQATRSEVTSHLRSAYQPWKHRMQARARREAGNSSAEKTSRDHTGKEDDKITPKSSNQPPTRAHKPQSAHISQLSIISSNSSSTLTLSNPSPFLHYGNSDPFASLALPITPLIAELIKFEHAHLHPCIYSTKNASSRAYGTSYLADMHGPPSTQAAVYGYLSRAAFVLSSASGDPKFKTAALVLKGRSTALLREELGREGESGPGVLRKILALMIAELFAHEYAAAGVHSRVLIGLLEERARTAAGPDGAEFDMRFFFSVVYSEVQRSCMSLTRPCFDVSPTGWVARMFESVGGAAFRRLLASMDIEEAPLEPAVLGIELAGIFGEVRTVRRVSEEYSNSPVYGTPTPLALYLPARVVLCLGRMVRFYMDHCAGRGVWDLLPRELIHRAAVLGALYWVRKAGHIDSIRVSSTSTIYSAGPMILGKLRESLDRFDKMASPGEGELYAGLRFWVLYIGSQEEQGRKRKGEGEVEMWFTTRLVEAARRVGVYTWQQAQPILERYPHPDAAEPHGSTWFSGIFAAWNNGGKGIGLGAVFEGISPPKRMEEPGRVGLGGGIYGSGDDYMTWSTKEAMEEVDVVLGGAEMTCEKLRQSINPPRGYGGTFACPNWDIGQESYWAGVSGPRDTDLLENDTEVDGNGRQQTPSHADPVTGWIGSQSQSRSSRSPTPPPSQSYRYPGISLDAHTTSTVSLPVSQSHLFHSSAPCWQSNCQIGGCERGVKPLGMSVEGKMMRDAVGKSFTAKVNDPKLTGISSGEVMFGEYPIREMDRTETMIEARRYEFF